ncbi:uncharacterized protein DS421_18g621210 [Arachis hypogaea]|nr:uncharacterized protein DS421_18g621210 [Arachis hypogaea]
MGRKNDAGIGREAEVVWRKEGGGLFGLPFAPPRLSRSATVAPLTASARVCRRHLTTAGKHRGGEKSEKTRGETERPEAEIGFSHHAQSCSHRRRRLRRSCHRQKGISTAAGSLPEEGAASLCF